ncbi:hypothetical protein K439DRAFT_1550676 [Ramaria rubella]|nr:hypothetical protein K439DRAFT_1550676 [Ramaria rubella]
MYFDAGIAHEQGYDESTDFDNNGGAVIAEGGDGDKLGYYGNDCQVNSLSQGAVDAPCPPDVSQLQLPIHIEPPSNTQATQPPHLYSLPQSQLKSATIKRRGVDLSNNFCAKHVANNVGMRPLSLALSISSTSCLITLNLSRSMASPSVSSSDCSVAGSQSWPAQVDSPSTSQTTALALNPPSPATSSVPSHWSNNSFPSCPETPVLLSPSASEIVGGLQWDKKVLSSAGAETKAFIIAADAAYKQNLLVLHMYPEVVTRTYAIRQKVAGNLVKNTNFFFKKVGINVQGDLLLGASGIHYTLELEAAPPTVL